nr:39S ribosomal protein L39 mitochondrial [Hymenolepis microstoma]
MFPLFHCRFASNIVNATKVSSRLANVEYPSEIANRSERWSKSQRAERNYYMAPRPEFIKVVYHGQPHPGTELEMAKGLSTPFDCAKHMTQMLCDRSVIAIVDGCPHDMHRPLRRDAKLDFMQFKDINMDPTEANFAFWRSCQLVMAAAVESAFEENFQMRLLAFHQTHFESGSFVADFRMELETREEFDKMVSWIPSEYDLRAISVVGQTISAKALPFECLDLDRKGCLEVMQDGYRMMCLDDESSQKNCTLYRIGNYVQVYPHGPMISSTSQIGRFSVSSFRLLGGLSSSEANGSNLQLVYRAQGIAIPAVFLTHFTTYDLLLRRARQQNMSISETPNYVRPL